MRRMLTLLVSIGLLALTVPAGARDQHRDELHDLRVATARFHSITQAEKAGYQLGYMAPFLLGALATQCHSGRRCELGRPQETDLARPKPAPAPADEFHLIAQPRLRHEVILLSSPPGAERSRRCILTVYAADQHLSDRGTTEAASTALSGAGRHQVQPHPTDFGRGASDHACHGVDRAGHRCHFGNLVGSR